MLPFLVAEDFQYCRRHPKGAQKFRQGNRMHPFLVPEDFQCCRMHPKGAQKFRKKNRSFPMRPLLVLQCRRCLGQGPERVRRTSDMPFGMVGRTHEWRALHVAEPLLQRYCAVCLELVGVDVLSHRDVLARRPQVLPYC